MKGVATSLTGQGVTLSASGWRQNKCEIVHIRRVADVLPLRCSGETSFLSPPWSVRIALRFGLCGRR